MCADSAACHQRAMLDQREEHATFSRMLPGFDDLRAHIELTRANTCSFGSYAAKSRHAPSSHEGPKHRSRPLDYNHNTPRPQVVPYFHDGARNTQTAEPFNSRWPMNVPAPFASDPRATMPVLDSACPLFVSPNLYSSAYVPPPPPPKQSNRDLQCTTRVSFLESVTEEPKKLNVRPAGIWNPAFLDESPPKPAVGSVRRVHTHGATAPSQIPIQSNSSLNLSSVNSRMPRLAADEIRSGTTIDSCGSKTMPPSAPNPEPLFHGNSDAEHKPLPMFLARLNPVPTNRNQKKSSKIKDLPHTVFKPLDPSTDKRLNGINTTESAQAIHSSPGSGTGEMDAQMSHKENLQLPFEQMRSENPSNRKSVDSALNEMMEVEPQKVSNGIDCSAALTASAIEKERIVARNSTEMLCSKFMHNGMEFKIEFERDPHPRSDSVKIQAPASSMEYRRSPSPLPAIEIGGNSGAKQERKTSEKHRDSAPLKSLYRGNRAKGLREGIDVRAIEADNGDGNALGESSGRVTLHRESARTPALPKLCALYPEEVAKLPEVRPSSRSDVTLCLDNLVPYLVALSACEFNEATNEVLCSHCSDTFSSLSKLREHLGLAMKFLPYRCTRCTSSSVLHRGALKHCSENHRRK